MNSNIGDGFLFDFSIRPSTISSPVYDGDVQHIINNTTGGYTAMLLSRLFFIQPLRIHTHTYVTKCIYFPSLSLFLDICVGKA